jgi:uncharacterized protein YfbU (UPF0304 family)
MSEFNRYDRLEEIMMEGFSEEDVLLEILDLLSEEDARDILDTVEDNLLSAREAEDESDDEEEEDDSFDDEDE